MPLEQRAPTGILETWSEEVDTISPINRHFTFLHDSIVHHVSCHLDADDVMAILLVTADAPDGLGYQGVINLIDEIAAGDHITNALQPFRVKAGMRMRFWCGGVGALRMTNTIVYEEIK